MLLERLALNFLFELVIVLSLKVWIAVMTRQILTILPRGLLELQVDLRQAQQQPRLVRMLEPPVMALVQVLPPRLQGDSPVRLSRLLLRHLISCLLTHLLKHLQEELIDHLPQAQVPALVPIVAMPKPIML